MLPSVSCCEDVCTLVKWLVRPPAVSGLRLVRRIVYLSEKVVIEMTSDDDARKVIQKIKTRTHLFFTEAEVFLAKNAKP